MKKIFLIIITITTLFGCDKEDKVVQLQSLNEYLAKTPDLSIFNAAIDKANLQDFKNGGGPFTWFMPNNQALTSVGITLDSINKLTPGQASYFVNYHLLNTKLLTIDLVAQNSIPRNTLLGLPIYIGGSNGNFFVNGSKIISANNELSNGVVHIIEKPNTPVNLVGNIQAILNRSGKHSLFIAALTKANKWTLFSGTVAYTVIAPTDSAMTVAGLTSAVITSSTFGRIDSIVRYHYFNSFRLFTNDLGNRETPQTALGAGRTITSSGNGFLLKGKTNASPVPLTTTNLLGTNGVVHITDGILRF